MSIHSHQLHHFRALTLISESALFRSCVFLLWMGDERTTSNICNLLSCKNHHYLTEKMRFWALKEVIGSSVITLCKLIKSTQLPICPANKLLLSICDNIKSSADYCRSEFSKWPWWKQGWQASTRLVILMKSGYKCIY